MDLNNLSAEYRGAADRLQQRLAELRERLPEAIGEEAFLMQRRIDALYSELTDLRVVMTYLKNYYNS